MTALHFLESSIQRQWASQSSNASVPCLYFFVHMATSGPLWTLINNYTLGMLESDPGLKSPLNIYMTQSISWLPVCKGAGNCIPTLQDCWRIKWYNPCRVLRGRSTPWKNLNEGLLLFSLLFLSFCYFKSCTTSTLKLGSLIQVQSEKWKSHLWAPLQKSMWRGSLLQRRQ